MLNLNEIKLNRVIQINNEPYLIVKAEHHQMGRGGAVLKTKLKNLSTGSVLEKTFQGNDKAEEANTETRKANFMYKDKDNAYFMDNTTYEQFSLTLEQIGSKDKFLKEDTEVSLLYFNEQPITLNLPTKIELKVVSAPPGVKGNSTGNVTKQVELETGISINAPLFINEGDVIRVNTDTEEYVERV